jgi:hypothetical protein
VRRSFFARAENFLVSARISAPYLNPRSSI